jgi:hypothetical protein
MEAKDKIKEMLLSDDSEMICLGIILSRTQLTERQRIEVYSEIQKEKPNKHIRLHNGKIKKSKK